MSTMNITPATYIVAGCKPWNRRAFLETLSKQPGEWRFVATREELQDLDVVSLKPRYIFFLHWSWKVPDELVNQFECVCFHMTDVPYGRGGSPLQNLIVRGHRSTMMTALRMVHDFDAGPVYAKEELSLEGGAEEIYIRANALAATMIARLTKETPTPVPQMGKPTIFTRRKPEESRLPEADSLSQLHDFIRMLDAEGYPRAFFDFGRFRLEFHRAALYEGRIEADVTIKERET